MPTISLFYGIMVLMFYRDNRQHHLPHIHVRYQDEEAVIAIESGEVLQGALPVKQMKLVQAWVELRKEDLMADWQLAVNGEEPFRIAPLQ
jgi:desulfoferrodoxin (superoxide reductase-like protein)